MQMTDILHPIQVEMPLLIVSKSVECTLIAGEDEALSVPACVDLASLFDPRAFGYIKRVEELSLSANSPRHSAVCHAIITSLAANVLFGLKDKPDKRHVLP
jgi:hypothetical protein